jgi:flagellar biosynthesis/type III secretory pathway protein FliH
MLTLRSAVTIRVNRADLEKVRGALHELAQGAGGQIELRVIEDGAVARGGCVVETPEFIVDGRIDSQLHEARRALERGGP